MDIIKLYLLNILSLNERFAYNLIGKLRLFVAPWFNNFLRFQKNQVRHLVKGHHQKIRQNLVKVLPNIGKKDLRELINNEQHDKIIEAAERILLHQFEILSVNVNFEKEIDWHIDINSGFRWPKGKLFSKYDQVNGNNNADVKYPRELSRCHHFLMLGEAYLLTRDEKYTKEFISQVRHWIGENPYKRSINWGCSMDIAIRASNWVYGLRMFMNSSLIDDVFFNEIMTSLFLHGRFIYENPEKNRVYNHNHYLSDLAGQILLSLIFDIKACKEAEQWMVNGIYEFFREIRIQILPTGFTYERSTNYHRLVTELISYTIIILKNSNIEIPQDILYRVRSMLKVVRHYLFADGTAPIIGDQDNGRYLPFYTFNINYQRYLLNIGAVLFQDGILKSDTDTNSIDVLFLFGNYGLDQLKGLELKTEKLSSHPFPDAGFYIMRSKKVYLFINNSGLSHYNEVPGGTHTHSDLLSFFYAYNGTPFLIDPGTYVYSSNPKERMKFRSTGMHNTITVDDYDQNDLDENNLWSIRRDALPISLDWKSNEEFDMYLGAHTGYERLNDPVKHMRKFELNKSDNSLEIKDTIECDDYHQIKCHFHFDKNVTIKLIDKSLYCQKEGNEIHINFGLERDYSLELKEEFISESYNSKTLAPYVIVSFETNSTIELTTVIKSS